MATSSFLNRWSKRKLEQASNHADTVDQVAPSDKLDKLDKGIEERCSESLQNEDLTQIPEPVTDSAFSEKEKTEGMSIANLLVSEASESVKKAALRKLFLSEEFNVRDGLDDYDDDYSNLKSLSEGVADTLRDWIKEQPEEPIQEAQAISAEDRATELECREPERESDENLTHAEKLSKNTVDNVDKTIESALTSEQVGQNIPH